jgi:hypothetical protein
VGCFFRGGSPEGRGFGSYELGVSVQTAAFQVCTYDPEVFAQEASLLQVSSGCVAWGGGEGGGAWR